MHRLIISLFTLFASMMLLVTGGAGLSTLLGVRMGQAGLPTEWIGVVMACYSLGFVLGTFGAERVILRVGHIRAFAALAGVLAVAALAYPLHPSPWFWGALRLLTGLAMAGLMVVIESWLASAASHNNRGSLFAIYQIAFYLATSSGQWLVALGGELSPLPFMVASMLLSAALIPLSLSRMQTPTVEYGNRLSIAAVYRAAPLGLVGALMCGICVTSFYSLGPVFAARVGFSVEQISTFMALSVMMVMLFCWPVGYLCDRFERVRVLQWLLCAAMGAALLAALLAREHLLLTIVLCGSFIGLVASTYPVLVALTADRIDAAQVVSMSTTLLLAYGVGGVLGPLLLAQSMGLLGPSGLFYGNLLVLALMSALVLYRRGRGQQVPVEAQEQFVTTLPEAAGTLLSEIDPRNPDFVEQDSASDQPAADLRDNAAPNTAGQRSTEV